MLVVREINGDQQYDAEIISHSDELETARNDFIDWLIDTDASETYIELALVDFDGLDVAFDSTFEHSNSADWIDRYEWLCASTAHEYMAA